MFSHEMQFTTGQFARMHHINKRTLHYYDSIGLFSPAGVGENGYRYYTYLQGTALEMLLTMRELDMSIEEIDRYLKHRSAEGFHKIIADKTAEIDAAVKRLKEIRRLLAIKEQQLCMCEQMDNNRVEKIECAQEYLLLSKSVTGTYDARDFAVFMEQAHALGDHRLFNKSYGSMISVEKVAENRFAEDDCFFTKVEKPRYKAELFVKPGGSYLRALCRGNWDKLPDARECILKFASAQGFRVKGYFYEEGLNEMAIAEMEDYVTQITVLCEPEGPFCREKG
ncbi:MAG: MerR family transcriptional regulator [Ruthenibacterium sp.]